MADRRDVATALDLTPKVSSFIQSGMPGEEPADRAPAFVRSDHGADHAEDGPNENEHKEKASFHS